MGVMRHDKTCRQCGAQALAWGHTTKGFRLFEPSGELHVCRQEPKACTKCDTPNLHWVSRGGQFVLVDVATGYMHRCPDKLAEPWKQPGYGGRTPSVVVKTRKVHQCGKCGKPGLFKKLVDGVHKLVENDHSHHVCGDLLGEV